MKILRFVLPFLFVRNWHSGIWELSPSRLYVFGAISVFVLLGIVIAYFLQSPVTYSS